MLNNLSVHTKYLLLSQSIQKGKLTAQRDVKMKHFVETFQESKGPYQLSDRGDSAAGETNIKNFT